MPSSSDKWIRSIKDNTAGKVVADPEGNRWQWEADEDTARLLKKLNNDALAIEKTDIRPNPASGAKNADARKAGPLKKPGTRDSGGGFNPYDHAGKAKRR